LHHRAANNDPTLAELHRTAKDALLAGGRILKLGYAAKRRVFFKTLTSPVTHIDMMSERAVIGLIRRRFPTHGFLAEESSYLNEMTKGARRRVATGLRMAGGMPSHAAAGAGHRWIIDPLDGTVNFLHGLPQSCVSVAVEREGVILAGGVYDPFRDELFMAMRGRGATLNGKRIRVSSRAPLQRSLLVTGFPYDHQRRAAFYLAFLEPFLRRSMDLRRLGAAALDLAWVACGRVEGYWEFNLNPWDVAAGWLLVEEAGGTLTDFSGARIDIDRPAETLASNGKIHAEMLHVMKTTRSRLRRKTRPNQAKYAK
jgi:myo-inositol-1(or 4)-monophosphatase